MANPARAAAIKLPRIMPTSTPTVAASESPPPVFSSGDEYTVVVAVPESVEVGTAESVGSGVDDAVLVSGSASSFGNGG